MMRTFNRIKHNACLPCSSANVDSSNLSPLDLNITSMVGGDNVVAALEDDDDLVVMKMCRMRIACK